MREQAVVELLKQPRLDLGSDAVPFTIDRRPKHARACSRRSQLTLAQVAPPIAANAPQRNWLTSHTLEHWACIQTTMNKGCQ